MNERGGGFENEEVEGSPFALEEPLASLARRRFSPEFRERLREYRRAREVEIRNLREKGRSQGLKGPVTLSEEVEESLLKQFRLKGALSDQGDK